MTLVRRFASQDHQDKYVPFVQALLDAGYTQAVNLQDGPIDFYLVDFDRNHVEMKECLSRRIPVFVYPHSARSIVAYDGIYSPWPHTRCNFVFGEGQKEIARRIKYPCPVEILGWPFPLRDFHPTQGLKVLFAPIHPNGGGIKLTQPDRDLNLRTFNILRSLGIKFTVRYGRNLEDGNIPYFPHDPFTKYEKAEMSVGDSIRAIDNSDLVIGHQMFAFLSVGMGKPTVMFGEDVAPHSVRRPAKSWDKYRDLLRFPLDLLDTSSPRDLLIESCVSDEKIRSWRSQFIGEAFSPSKFVDTIEKYLK